MKEIGLLRNLFEPIGIRMIIGSVSNPPEVPQALKSQSLELVRIPVTATAETAQATEILCAKNIQAIAQISDNTTALGIGQIVHKAEQQNIPTFVFVSSQMKAGATTCVALDFFDAVVEASEKALRVLLGESPGNIPLYNTRSKKVIINAERAAQFGFQ